MSAWWRSRSACFRGPCPSSRPTVPLASLRVHHPQTLHRVRASLREEPLRRPAIVLRVLEGAMVWHVYRDESGALVMYDDYAAYLVALELGCQMVGVKILGEVAS
jgi:hypothetical protein